MRKLVAPVTLAAAAFAAAGAYLVRHAALANGVLEPVTAVLSSL